MNVNLDATTRALEMVSPSRLVPVASVTRDGVRKFVDAERSLFGSLVRPKEVVHTKPKRPRTHRHHEAVPA